MVLNSDVITPFFYVKHAIRRVLWNRMLLMGLLILCPTVDPNREAISHKITAEMFQALLVPMGGSVVYNASASASVKRFGPQPNISIQKKRRKANVAPEEDLSKEVALAPDADDAEDVAPSDIAKDLTVFLLLFFLIFPKGRDPPLLPPSHWNLRLQNRLDLTQRHLN